MLHRTKMKMGVTFNREYIVHSFIVNLFFFVSIQFLLC